MDTPRYLPRAGLNILFDELSSQGYTCLGPVVEDGAIVFRPVDQVEQLPKGLRSDQQPGQYRLVSSESERCFAWANGPQGLKPLLFQPRETLWRSRLDESGQLRFEEAPAVAPRLAVFGVRACDLAALRLHDAHFTQGEHVDSHYAARRANLLIIAVDCAFPAATCFCASTGDGPAVQQGHDLRLSELENGYVIWADSDAGRSLLASLPSRRASARQLAQVEQQTHDAANSQQRNLPSRDLNQFLFDRLEHPRWADVADRCLSCGNCTAVCPTCFCADLRSDPVTENETSDQVREWSSCFSPGHASMHGYQVRPDTRSRYRQWLTHKLGSWHDQFGRSGCVGCGRCIAWCPTGIDLTAEIAALAQRPEAGAQAELPRPLVNEPSGDHGSEP